MAQYKYQVKKGVKWMVKFNYTDPKTGKTKTEYKRGFASKREARDYEDEFLENLTVRKILFTNGHLKMFSTNTLCHTREKILRNRHYKQNTIFLKSIFSRLFGMC